MKTKTETNRSPLGFPSGSFPERPARRETGYWHWGSDNLFPNALAAMSRLSTTHRRIINDKADYISGKGFVCDRENPAAALVPTEPALVVMTIMVFLKSTFRP